MPRLCDVARRWKASEDTARRILQEKNVADAGSAARPRYAWGPILRVEGRPQPHRPTPATHPELFADEPCLTPEEAAGLLGARPTCTISCSTPSGPVSKRRSSRR